MRIDRTAWFTSALIASIALTACSMNDGGMVGGTKDANKDGIPDDQQPSLGGDELDGLAATPGCADGKLTSDEACDDSNREDGDGCAANCRSVELGFSCPTPGEACIAVARCGDGVVVAPEQCDDGGKEAGDGCSPTCKYEPGWKCEGSPSTCSATVCNDGKTEGAESCEDGNTMPFDGCSAFCQNEPNCATGACTSTCGDGVVVSEACDDGNQTNGDGCDENCKAEAGYTCRSPVGDSMKVPMIVRDFNAGGDFEKGESFARDLNFANQGLLKATLEGPKRKPALAATTGTFNGAAGKPSGIASAESFAMWYDETAPASGNTRNGALATTLNLYLNDDKSAYVNRFGVGGDGLTSAKYERTVTQKCIGETQVAYDDSGAVMPCYACYYDKDPNTPQCDDGAQACNIGGVAPTICNLVGADYMGTVVQASFDGNPLFFPADALTPFSPTGLGQISGNYHNSWPVVPDIQHNFSFTSEVRYWFQYDASKSYKLRFVGDDDVWVFINGKLAVDLGGIHTATQGELTITSAGTTTTVLPTNVDPVPAGITSAPDLGLTDGGVYEIVVLHAERQTTASSYQLTLSGFSAAPSDCSPVCGDAIVGIGEECDDGVNAGGYGKCGPGCAFEQYCGDGNVDPNEECDDGNNVDGDGCGSGCRNIVIT